MPRMPRITTPISIAAAILAAVLAGCTSTSQAPTAPQRVPPSAPAATPQGGVSRAQLEAAGNACEKMVANAVKTRYPQPGSVMMMPDRERIAQQSLNQTTISGEGTFEPDASDETMAFRYTCLYNLRTQRVDDVQMRYGTH